jgi:hypothetical protein
MLQTWAVAFGQTNNKGSQPNFGGYVQDVHKDWTGVLTENLWEVMMLASTHNTRGTINDTRTFTNLMKTTWSSLGYYLKFPGVIN